MYNMLINDEIKIVHQGVDTLVLSCFCNDEVSYNKVFKPFVERVKICKEDAKALNSYGGSDGKFVKNSLGLGLGDFLISSTGKGAFIGFVKNSDIFFFVGDSPYGSLVTPQIKIQFTSLYLLKVGHVKAHEIAKHLLQRILGHYRIKVNRIDLCTDITGIRYTPSDAIRFQSLKRRAMYSDIMQYEDESIETDKLPSLPVLNEHTLNEFARYQKFEGVQFGKSPHMFRIYDKIKQISPKKDAPYVFAKWKLNGLELKPDSTVFRHEVELGRGFLKTIIPPAVDEVDFVFKNLPSLWSEGLGICQWVDLTSDEISKISELKVQPQAISRIYIRAKADKTRFDLWGFINQWDGVFCEKLEKLPYIKQANIQQCKKALKAFVSAVYTHVGANPYNLSYVVNEVVREMSDEGLSLHNYGVSKLASSFVENQKSIEKSGLSLHNPFQFQAHEGIKEFNKALSEIQDTKAIKPIEKALEILKYA